ncbi:unnamed protein product [Ilex paraguariensis]|uniref:Uncharacterized protein n=1 Tax=Ilex paraguariensis TaxID=185542 RepID=A0ABC8U6A0_9AQUA
MDIIGDKDKESEPFEALLDVVTFETTQRDGETKFERAEAYADQIQDNFINKERIGVLIIENEELKKVIKCMERNKTTKKQGEKYTDNVVMETQVPDFVIKLMEKDIQISEMENLVKVMKKENDNVKAEMT